VTFEPPTATGGLALWVGLKFLKILFPTLAGIIAGLQTQPAVLAYAKEQMQDERTDFGYSSVYPGATLAKLILAQLLLG